MRHYSVDKDNSSFEINAAKNALSTRVSGINMDFTFDYKVVTETEWLNEVGQGGFTIGDSSIDLLLSLTNKNGALAVDFSEVKIFL